MIDKIIAWINAVQNELRKDYLATMEDIEQLKAWLRKIKSWLGLVILFVLVAVSLQAMAGKPLIENDLQLIKAQEASLLKAGEVNAVKIGQLESDVKLSNQMIADLKLNMQAQASAIAGVNNKVQSTSVGRDQSTVNDSAIFIRYTEAQEKLSKTYENIIIVLIVQLIALLTLFVKKDWDMAKIMVESNERETARLLDLISEDEEREDKKEEVKP